jgi:hypothetical protein
MNQFSTQCDKALLKYLIDEATWEYETGGPTGLIMLSAEAGLSRPEQDFRIMRGMSKEESRAVYFMFAGFILLALGEEI